MNAIQAYFFDLDGTLTDAREGLYASFRAALNALKIDGVDDARLESFLGTPLPEMFRELSPDISRNDVAKGIAAFRIAYEAGGIKKNNIYPGVMPMLADVASYSAKAWIVTSKPEGYAIDVVRDLGIKEFISGVVGAGLDENDTKGELIARALKLSRVAPSAAIMLGDRSYDVIGAIENEVTPVGALWGYGTTKELRDAGCRLFVSSPDEFHNQYVGAGAKSRLLAASYR